MPQKKMWIDTMLSVVILNNGEANVIQLTFENLYKELKDIYGSELLVKDKWFDLEHIRNRYVCFVEADCLVEPGFFKSQMEKFLEKGYSRNMAMMSASTSVCYWDNKIYGYRLDERNDGLVPNRQPKSRVPFTVEVGYIPGAIIRVSMLKTILKDFDNQTQDLVYLSSELSMAFWRKSAEAQGKGYRVYLNPRTSYLTTEDYVNDLGKFETSANDSVMSLFSKESI